MQPSELEIQREVEALRDIRRRSTVQSGVLDPDLPDVSSDSSSSTAYWDSASSSSHGSSNEDDMNLADDPFHLFWVPARLHPEIAPAEFRQFLKEHARDGPTLARSSSLSSTALGRKKSMLSRQYDPSEKDEAEDEVVPLRRNRTSRYANPVPQLTINDLQKLEELAEEASTSHDSTKLRSVLRRSLSLNISPSVIEKMDDVPDVGEDADAPIIVPRPGQILRRAARTKVRKPGTGDGPHKFTTRTRRAPTARSATAPGEQRTSSDFSSSDHGDEPVRRGRADSDVLEPPTTARPDSYSEESSIYDAYARDDNSDESEQHTASTLVTSPEQTVEFATKPSSPPAQQPPLEAPYEAISPTSPVVSPVPQQLQPQRTLSPPAAQEPPPAPETVVAPVVQAAPIVAPQPTRPPLITPAPIYQPPVPPVPPVPVTSPGPSDQRKEREKDKKGLFGKWGGDKGTKKGHKDHQREKEKEKEKEKDSSFFGSLFGGKKKQDEPSSPPSGGLGGGGREAAVALLGASKSAKSHPPSPSPQPIQGYARYPIHVERAIYRLSHIKLANPRRPLYEQVLISNLMFWYLGVINKTQAQPQAAATPQQAPVPNGDADKENEQVDQEKREREEREQAEKERQEKEREQREREQKEREQKERAEQKRRGSLTKSPAPGTPGARRAEMPVRGPQYDMQHRAIEQEYGYQGGNPPMGRTPQAPPIPMNYAPQGARSPGGQQPPLPYQQGGQLVQPQPQAQMPNRYYTPPGAPPMPNQQYMGQPPTQLPPGAMPPVAIEPSWNQSGPLPSQRATSPPSANPGNMDRARSPPHGQRYTPLQEKQAFNNQGRGPGRSLSATASPGPQHPHMNGKLRKGSSAHAVMPHQHQHQQRVSEEEDIPLAMYQQRRK